MTAPDPGRDETPAERLDRNWGELLQELRVSQAGSQILTGFLISLPFQSGFSRLTVAQQRWYGVTVVLSLAATVMQLAPVLTHRLVFRRHEKDVLLRVADAETRVALALLGLTLLAGLALVVWVVFGLATTAAALGSVTVLIVVTWLVIPLRLRSRPTPRSYDR